MKSNKETSDMSFKQMKSSSPIADAIRASIDNDTTPCCYICMETTHGEVNMPMELIAPCPCNSYVHRKCLDRWRAASTLYNAMTNCPNCRVAYIIDETGENEEDLKRRIFRAQMWRLVLVLGAVLLGSMIIYLIDAGTPKFFNLHWNALDGEIYRWVGLTHVPRFVIYFLLSLAMTLFIAGCVVIVRWCYRNCCFSSNHTSPVDDGCCICMADCCNGMHLGSSMHCGDCGGASDCCGDCGDGGEICGIFFLVFFAISAICVIFAGLVMLMTAIVGGVGTAVDRQRARRVRGLQVQLGRIRNLRPLTAQVV